MECTDAIYFKDNHFSYVHHRYEANDKFEFADKLANDSSCILHTPIVTSYNMGIPIKKEEYQMQLDGKTICLRAYGNLFSEFYVYLGENAFKAYVAGVSFYTNYYGEWRLSSMKSDDFIDFLNLAIAKGLKYACEKHLEVLQKQLNDLETINKWWISQSRCSKDFTKEFQSKMNEIASKTTLLSEKYACIQNWLNQNF